jgi:dipeptidase E
MKGCFVGSGSEGLQQSEVAAQILQLTNKSASDVTVLYLGTATYDLPSPKYNQTVRFQEAGCIITEIIVVGKSCTDPSSYASLCGSADVIVVSGGNTLWAVDKWNSIGLVPHIIHAAKRGAVLTGGSAGAICWFDAGHSDSMDSDSYKAAMVAEAAREAAQGSLSNTRKDESSAAPTSSEDVKSWQYVRCPCLGIFPGLVCPHADKVQSNGVLRATDFDAMLLRHPGERGICIDHFAALCVDGDAYWVLSLPGRPGSVLPDGTFSATREGAPGIWRKDVVLPVEQGEASAVDNAGGSCGANADTSARVSRVVTTLVPERGLLRDLLVPATEIVPDMRIEAVRAANPL